MTISFDIQKFYPGIDMSTGFTTVIINNRVVLDDIFGYFVKKKRLNKITPLRKTENFEKLTATSAAAIVISIF